ncbi:unnamed protein product [Cuscuta epithymum]|uniref:Amino acid transporter transmembrane domain-containing protein n=1 Tax=Cuscuta epithymum TaxID=186058 RepID=A0AAV0DQS6_9ASTE|nr:unnamed protein product [Cuscuta epithymum]
MDAVRTHLGGTNFMFCAIAQYATLIGLSTGYAITTALSLGAIERTTCYHKKGRNWPDCSPSTRNYIFYFGVLQIILSQIPNIRKLSFISVVASLMSFTYSIIGVALATATIARGLKVRISLTGVPIGTHNSAMDKMWNTFSAIGNIAISFAFSIVLIEIQDTLKASPRENKVMKEATCVGIIVSSAFYALCGILGYVAFGNDAPGNLLTDNHAFYEPYWLLGLANACIAVHLVGAYQVFSQPVFEFVESWCMRKWGGTSRFMRAEYNIVGRLEVSLFRIVWRTTYVMTTMLVALIFPFFNAFVGLLGAISFWPLTIYFPIKMYILQAHIQKWSLSWISLHTLSFVCFIVSFLAAAGSIRNLIKSVLHYKPFA